jgi:hypothetical protein
VSLCFLTYFLCNLEVSPKTYCFVLIHFICMFEFILGEDIFIRKIGFSGLNYYRSFSWVDVRKVNMDSSYH